MPPGKKKGAKPKAKANSTEAESKTFKVGDVVEALHEDGKFYDATVTSITEDGAYTVDFDGANESANVKQIQERNGSAKKKPPPVNKPGPKKKAVKKQPTQTSTPVDNSPRQTRSASSPASSPSKLAPSRTPSPKSVTKAKGAKSTPVKESPAKKQEKKQPAKKVTDEKKPKSRVSSAKPSPSKESPAKGSQTKKATPTKGSPKMSLSKQFKLAEKQQVPSSPKRGRAKAKQQPSLPKKRTNKTQKWTVGDVVEALWDTDGFFYEAKIEKVHNTKGGTTYDLVFVEDNVEVKGRKGSQIQSVDEEEEEEEEEEEQRSRSGSNSPTKRKKVEDEEYIEGERKVNAEDFVIESKSSEEGSNYEKKTIKRKRVAPPSPKKVTKKRKLEIRYSMSKLTKDQILNLVFDSAEKSPTIFADFEKSLNKIKK